MSHAGESISKMLDKKPAKEQGPKRYIIKSFYVMQHKKLATLVEYNAFFVVVNGDSRASG